MSIGMLLSRALTMARRRRAVRVAAAAVSYRHRDLAPQLRKQRAALRVNNRLLALDLLPFRVSGHEKEMLLRFCVCRSF
jgi:hypothetical protein